MNCKCGEALTWGDQPTHIVGQSPAAHARCYERSIEMETLRKQLEDEKTRVRALDSLHANMMEAAVKERDELAAKVLAAERGLRSALSRTSSAEVDALVYAYSQDMPARAKALLEVVEVARRIARDCFFPADDGGACDDCERALKAALAKLDGGAS